MSFKKFNVSQEIHQGIEAMDYTAPTAIQEESIQDILEGHNVLIQSQTGSGKTAAFGIPLMDRVDWSIRTPQVVVIVPTRELALQVQKTLFDIARYKRLNVVALFGKTSFDHQVRDLKGRVHVVVATPGRLLDHIAQETIDISAVNTMVLDEMDELLNMGFLDDTMTIAHDLKRRKQTILLSATVPNTVLDIAEDLARNYVFVNPAHEESTVVERLDQYAIFCEPDEKQDQLFSYLVKHNVESAIVFFNQKMDVDRVYEGLRKQLPIERMHGNLPQKQRTQIIKAFKAGKFRFLFASDVAARGLDIDSVALIVNFDVPHTEAIYQHRIGRSARLDKEGQTLTLISRSEKAKWMDVVGNNEVSTMEYQTPPTNGEIKDYASWIYSHREVEIQTHDDILKLHIKGGKQQKIRVGDIVGAITAIEGIAFEDIGVVSVLEESTYVDILGNKGKTVLKALQDQKIKGRVRRVEIAHPEA